MGTAAHSASGLLGRRRPAKREVKDKRQAVANTNRQKRIATYTARAALRLPLFV